MKRLPVSWKSIPTRVAVASAALVALSTAAYVTAPHLRPVSETTGEVQLVQPAAEEPVTVDTTAPEAAAAAVQATDGAERAEQAAGRAETAADRAEIAAVHVDQVVATTTTTAPPTTTTTTRPTGVLVEVPHETTTSTSTTTVPKTWVIVARFPVGATATTDAPLKADVVLQTGQLRVSGFPTGGPLTGPATSMVWFGETDGLTPGQACPPTADNTGSVIEDSVRRTPDCVWRGGWAPGPHVIVAGSNRSGGWTAPFGSRTNASGEIIVEEYR